MNTQHKILVLFFPVILLLGICSQDAFTQTKLSLPYLFSDNMVLQRDVNASVWGKGEPGKIVTVQINQYEVIAPINEKGKWMAKLPEQKAGGPYELSVSCGENKLVFKNVMIGDVWLASGQSNMALSFRWGTNNREEEVANANHPNLRLFQVSRNISKEPLDNLNNGKWLPCSPESVRAFSAVGYFFGRELLQKKNIPIGIIHSSWGGTRAEAWTSCEMLKTLPDFKDRVIELESNPINYQELWPISNKMADSVRFLIKNAKKGYELEIEKPKFDDSSWEKMKNPKSWADTKLKGFVGYVWFRKTIEIPKGQHKQDYLLSLGKITYEDITYFNGEEIGRTNLPGIHREYTIPKKLIKSGKNVIVVRVLNRWGNGGFMGPEDELFLAGVSKENKINLDTDWKFNENVEILFPEVIKYQDNPASIYNAMIAPLIPYNNKGTIWYQGESNAPAAYQYRTLLPTMIQDWRTRWGQGYTPFIIVQLANYGDEPKIPNDDPWAELREAQLITSQTLPNVGLAVTIDIGDGTDIHPGNKQDVGKRLALAARKLAYGEDLVYSGPIYNSMEIKEGKIYLDFTHIGSGLTSNNENLKGFAIAGKDKKFYWAEAKIVGDKVVVSSSSVTEPVAVRYGWDDNPACNLFNKEGLPASPFRTDNWPGITAKE